MILGGTRPAQVRRTSIYRLSVDFRPAAGNASVQLEHLIAVTPVMVTGSRITGKHSAYLQFRAGSDTEAAQLADRLVNHQTGPKLGQLRFSDARLTTGMAIHERPVPII